MTKRLKKILSIICMVTMLFSNLSLDSLFSPSGLTAAADAASGNPLDHVDDTMSPGEQRKGTIKAGETYNIRLTTGAGSILTLVGTGMDLWVDVVDESSPSDPSRYTSDGGELKVKWAASTNSYLLVFGAKKNGGSGKFTVTVDAEGEPAAASEQAAPAKRGNGMATAGLVFGILTFVFCFLPGLCFGFALLGLIFSIIGLVKRNAPGKGKAIAGLILTVLGFIGGIIFKEIIWTKVGEEINNSLDDFYEELETYDTGYKPNQNPDEYYIDGDFVTTDKGYVSGVLHIDNFIVEY